MNYELITVENNEVLIKPDISQEIAEFRRLKERVELLEKKLQRELTDAMEKRGIIKAEDPFLVLNYVKESEVNRFDTARFKKNFPETYSAYITTTTRKAYVRIKAK